MIPNIENSRSFCTNARTDPFFSHVAAVCARRHSSERSFRRSQSAATGMSTLADLYNPLTMPAALAKAHADLDKAVEKCYRPEPFHTDRERVEHLFRLYEQLTAPLLPATPKTRTRRSQTAATTSRPRRGRTPGLPSTNDLC